MARSVVQVICIDNSEVPDELVISGRYFVTASSADNIGAEYGNVELDDGRCFYGFRFKRLTEYDQLIGRTKRTHTLPIDSAARKEHPLFSGPFRYFPAALAAVAKLCKEGNDKHNPGEEMHHARGKSNDHADCILRHMLDMFEDMGQGVGRDEKGTPQVVMNAWRALALCQEWLEKHDGAPLAPGAKLP